MSDYTERGIDYDLKACLGYNPQETFKVIDIDKVLAVWEGENDEDDWRWVLRLKDGRFVFLQGGCDYTGWDCQSWADHAFADTPVEAAAKALDTEPISASFFHMLTLARERDNGKRGEVVASLLKQLADGKAQTWREKTNEELGIDPTDDGGVRRW